MNSKKARAASKFDPGEAGVQVCIADNPGKKGVTTGKTKRVGSRLMVEVIFGPNERAFRDFATLIPIPGPRDPLEEIADGSFGTDADLRRLVTLEKVRGRLTNVFYSMETSNTRFYPHQFKPVLKFLESPVGRLLIADEVGLGKTIEAGFVWKELQARDDARRFLVVCPAALQDKWIDDLRQKFSIHARKLGAKDLLEDLESLLEMGTPSEFVYVCSLEGLRTPSGFDAADEKASPRSRLGRVLQANAAADDRALFDLVIIDEAHEIRSPATAGNRLGHLLRDAARHLLLLTATPIQIRSDNLFQLLRLVSPDDFFDARVFEEILRANEPVNRALRHLWGAERDVEAARLAVEEAMRSPYFADSSTLGLVRAALGPSAATDVDLRIKLGNSLENASLLGQFMTRSRKRDVLKDRVERGAQTLEVRFSETEKSVYDAVTRYIRERANASSGIKYFAEVARQRQMASCMHAALENWQAGGFLDDVLAEGLGLGDWRLQFDQEEDEHVEDDPWPFADGLVDYEQLAMDDSKYEALRSFVLETLEENPEEKIIIFAFFRGTLTYLRRRLEADGVSTALIMGGMGDEKWETLRGFREKNEPNVLLSSEVGSQGIDLQFCRILVNYDLPWNPMRVEQRIGRIDRLGQKAERISIVNLILVDTIEERVLNRLYERMELFKESIGDLEEILGERTESLITELLAPGLTDEEMMARADAVADTIIRDRLQQRELEDQAINLVAYSDYVLASIDDSRNSGRWLRPREVLQLTRDFLGQNFQGSTLAPDDRVPNAFRIVLSDRARQSLQAFREKHRPPRTTELERTNRPVLCLFDPTWEGDPPAGSELVDATHPLLLWIRNHFDEAEDAAHPTAAIRLSLNDVPDLENGTKILPGLYAFNVHRWRFFGTHDDIRLSYRAIPVSASEPLPLTVSESLVSAAVLCGEAWANASNLIPDFEAFLEAICTLEELQHDEFQSMEKDFKAANADRCRVQLESARRFRDRRVEMFDEIIRMHELAGRRNLISANEVLKRREIDAFELKKVKLDNVTRTDSDLRTMCLGALLID